jgi:hypothetical protein
VKKRITWNEIIRRQKNLTFHHDANRFYMTLEEHRQHRYRKTITASDEAFFWQMEERASGWARKPVGGGTTNS